MTRTRQRGAAWRRAASASAWLGACAIARTAAATPPDGPAAKSYEEGARAQSRGDDGPAAIAFARADSVSPSEEAFSAAVGAALLADDVVIGTSLVERATGTGRPLSTREAALVERAQERSHTAPRAFDCGVSSARPLRARAPPGRRSWRRNEVCCRLRLLRTHPRLPHGVPGRCPWIAHELRGVGSSCGAPHRVRRGPASTSAPLSSRWRSRAGPP